MVASKSWTRWVPTLVLVGLTLGACSSDGDDQSGQEEGTDASVSAMPEGGQAGQDQQSPEFAAGVAERQRIAANYRDRMDRAKAAADAGRHEEARRLYSEARDFDPTSLEAQAGYRAMTDILGGTTPQDPGYDLAIAKQQEVQVKANHYYSEGIKARAEGRLSDAVDNLDRSYQLLKFNESPLAIDLNADLVKRVLDETREMADREERTRLQRHQEEIARLKANEEDRERQEVERRKRALWENLLAKFENEEFERVERIADEILRLDYKDTDAARMKESARLARLALAREKNVTEYREAWMRTFSEIKMKMIPEVGVMGFPNEDKWKQISSRGDLAISKNAVSQESEADRSVREALANTILPKVDWKAKTFSDVVDELRSQANVNIHVSPEARTASEDAGELGLEFSTVAAGEALAAVCTRCNVFSTVEDGLVKIQTKEEAGRSKVVEIYNVRDLVSGIRSFPGVQLNLNASGVGGEDSEPEEDAIEPTKNLEMDGLMELIKSTVDPAWDEDAGNRIDPKAETGILIVRQTPAKHRLIRKILSDLRQNTGVQVAIESRFITVENNFLQDIGVDLRGLGDDTAGTGVSGPGTNRVFDDFGQSGSGFGTPAAPIGLGTSNDTGVFFSDRNGNTDLRSRTENIFDEALGNPATLDNKGGFSFQFAYLDDVQLEAILRATQKYERINTVTSPRLMVYNTQRANLMVLNEISYVKDFDVEIAQAAVIADPIIDKIREGVILDVRPIVSHDRRYVTLELRPTVATLVRPIRNFTTQLGVGSAVTFQLPELQKQSVNTTVVIPDGGTLLLGGMKFAEEKTLESGVPVLKDVPILSFFFSHNGKSTNMRDLIILLKVQIVIGSEREPNADNGADLLK